jgi:hypothetical protein
MHEGHESLYVCVSKIQKLKIELNKKTLSYLFFLSSIWRDPNLIN